jgi:hypothetical protein
VNDGVGLRSQALQVILGVIFGEAEDLSSFPSAQGLADVAANESGGAGDQDGIAHDRLR